MRALIICTLVAASILSAPLAGRQSGDGEDLSATLTRIGHHVEQFYARARSIMCTETVRLQPLSASWSWDGPARQLVYELRVSWEQSADGEPPGEAQVLRHLLTVDGRPPRDNDKNGCMDPKPVSPEPLTVLLPSRRSDYAFTRAGSARVDHRPAIMFDYRATTTRPPEIVWRDECVSVDLPAQTRGRVWVDEATDDIVRLDEHLVGMFELRVPREHQRHGDPISMLIERADTSIRYRPVAFHDPEEKLMLPSSIDSFTVIRNAGVPRLRTTQSFSNYKRFMTDSRIVK